MIQSRHLHRIARLAACVAAMGMAAATSLAQQPAPFAAGDPAKGHTLVDRHCNACHVRLFGDPDRIYTREDRRVKNASQLRAQVAFCNTQLGTQLFPDEEEHIAAWLNQRYYGFKP